MKSIIKEIALAVLIALLCGETVFIVVQNDTNGSRTPWHKLDATPRPAKRIAWLDGTQVIVETADDIYYSYSYYETQASWVLVDGENYDSYKKLPLWQPTSDLAPPTLENVLDITYIWDPTPVHWTTVV